MPFQALKTSLLETVNRNLCFSLFAHTAMQIALLLVFTRTAHLLEDDEARPRQNEQLNVWVSLMIQPQGWNRRPWFLASERMEAHTSGWRIRRW